GENDDAIRYLRPTQSRPVSDVQCVDSEIGSRQTQGRLTVEKISRRDFLRTSIASAVGLGVMGSHLKSWASKTEFWPALGIRSGVGGAVAAVRVAEAGVQTVVLERGRRWPIQRDGKTFATFEQPDGRSAWLSTSTPITPIELAFGLPPAPPIDVFTGV